MYTYKCMLQNSKLEKEGKFYRCWWRMDSRHEGSAFLLVLETPRGLKRVPSPVSSACLKKR